MQVRSQQNDTLDLVVWRYLGDGAGYVEQALELNPHLAAHGAVLPGGTLIELPAPRIAPASTQSSISLWD
jgi:phage tail protein X